MSEIHSRTIDVGMLGYAFMGKAHSHAYRTLAHVVFVAGFGLRVRGARRA